MRHLPRLGLGLASLAAAALAAAAPADDVVTRARQSRLELLRSFVTPPTGESAAGELEATIQHIRSLQVRPKPSPRDGAAPTPTGTAPSPATSLDAAPPRPKTGGPVVTPEDLERLRRLPGDRIANPLALADALFLAGHYREAHTFYETALKADGNEKAKAWALFQMANCQRESDPAAGIALYDQILKDHPDSPWAAIAKTYRALAEGRLAARPPETEEPAPTPTAAPPTPPATPAMPRATPTILTTTPPATPATPPKKAP
jgi:tetratricopeptide (TPR) repeat protein